MPILANNRSTVTQNNVCKQRKILRTNKNTLLPITHKEGLKNFSLGVPFSGGPGKNRGNKIANTRQGEQSSKMPGDPNTRSECDRHRENVDGAQKREGVGDSRWKRVAGNHPLRGPSDLNTAPTRSRGVIPVNIFTLSNFAPSNVNSYVYFVVRKKKKSTKILLSAGFGDGFLLRSRNRVNAPSDGYCCGANGKKHASPSIFAFVIIKINDKHNVSVRL